MARFVDDTVDHMKTAFTFAETGMEYHVNNDGLSSVSPQETKHTSKISKSIVKASHEVIESNPLKKNDVLTLPPDGGWGWMVVLGSFLVHLITDGILYSFGIFYLEFLNYYKGGKGETAWIGSLASGFQLFAGPFASILTNKFGCRFTTIVGSVVAALGFVLSSFSPNLYFLYFSFGTLSGIGFSLTYLPAIVSVGHYFEKKRTFAIGLATCGSGIGAFILNPVSKYLFDFYAWRGAMLIQAGILLNCAICASVFRPLNQKAPVPESKVTETEDLMLSIGNDDSENASQEFTEASVPVRVPCERDAEETEVSLYTNQSVEKSTEDGVAVQCFQHEDAHYSDGNTTVTSLLSKLDRKAASLESIHDSANFAKKSCCASVNVPASLKQACNLSPLMDLIFIMYLLSNVLVSLCLHIPLMFLYDRTVDQGIDTDSAKWLGSIMGISTTFGRILSGLLADKLNVNRLFLFNVTLVLCGISTALCPLCFNYTLLVIYACLFGIFLGMYIPLVSVVLVDLLGIDMLTTSFGLLLMFKGMANLIGPPIAGWLYDGTGSYDLPFIVAGITMATSGIIVYAVICIRRGREKEGTDAEEPFETDVH